MATTTEILQEASASLGPWLEGADARTRLDMLADAAEAAREFMHDAKVARSTAMRAFVEEVGGASAAAKELGISRNRVYMLMAATSD